MRHDVVRRRAGKPMTRGESQGKQGSAKAAAAAAAAAVADSLSIRGTGHAPGRWVLCAGWCAVRWAT